MSRKILVTGAGGFIGSHLVEKLIQENYEVTAMCKYSSNASTGNLDRSKFENEYEIIFGDIRDNSFVEKSIRGKDIVINLAALIGIPYSYVAPDSYMQTNLIGTQNLLNASVNEGVSRFIQLSTSEVYGSAQYIPIDEKHALSPQSPYSASKIASDNLSLSYFNSFDLPVVIARPFNTYGPRQSNRAVIPTIISQILGGSKVLYLGNTHTVRDLNYVQDTANNLLTIIGSQFGTGEVVNIGGGGAYSISEIVEKFRIITGKDFEIRLSEERVRPSKSEVHQLVCDNSKFMKLFGPTISIDLELGLNYTLEWFGKNAQPSNLSRKYTI